MSTRIIPTEIVTRRIAEEAKALGLHGLALSDHDTIEGLEQMDHYGKNAAWISYRLLNSEQPGKPTEIW